jgi:hypothetical protein
MSLPRLLKLSPADNIAVALSEIAAGATAECEGEQIAVHQRIGVGHKVAIAPIPAGAKVLKLGCPIGSATSDIAPGDYVHGHNLKSDYLPTYTLERGHKFTEQAGETGAHIPDP